MTPLEVLKIRFYQKFEPVTESGCWIWTGNGGKRLPYGTQNVGDGKMVGAHRVSWMIHFGDIPAGINVCHKCDVPLCVNPNHLFLGTLKDNTQDMLNKGRHHPARGVDSGASKLTPEEVRAIRDSKKSITAIANEFGISRGYASQLRNMKAWKHL